MEDLEGMAHPNILIENSQVKYFYDIKLEDLSSFISTRLKGYFPGYVAVVVSILIFLYFNQ